MIKKVKNDEAIIIELVNGEKECHLEINTLFDVANRGSWSLGPFLIDNSWNDKTTKVLKKTSLDFIMVVFGLTSGPTYCYDWERFNCHCISNFLLTGILGTRHSDKTILQVISENSGILSPHEENKPVGQVGVKELLSILLNPKVDKRPRKKAD